MERETLREERARALAAYVVWGSLTTHFSLTVLSQICYVDCYVLHFRLASFKYLNEVVFFYTFPHSARVLGGETAAGPALCASLALRVFQKNTHEKYA